MKTPLIKIEERLVAPDFFHKSASAQLKETELFLDIDKFDVINNIQYKLGASDAPLWEQTFLRLPQLLIGKKIGEAFELSPFNFFREAACVDEEDNEGLLWSEDVPIFHLPIYLLQQAIESYRGRAPKRFELLKTTSDNLLCRCFKVYQSQVLDFLKVNPKASELDLIDEFQVTIGCGNCANDLEDLLGVVDFQLKGEAPIMWIETFHTIIQSFLTERPEYGDIHIAEFDGKILSLNCDLDLKKNKMILEALSAVLKDQTQEGLKVLFL
jgi:hypothetical protein